MFDGALNLNVSIFCADVVAAAREWLTDAEQTRTYQANYPLFVQRYVTGNPTI